MFLPKARKFILDILFPIECLGCKKDDVWLCEECLEKLSLTKGYFIPNDYKPSFMDGFLIASDWENQLLQDIIHKFKYNFARELAEPLGELLIKKLERVLEIYPNLKSFVIIPVPLHKKRLAWRGFNQAELLARQVANKLNMELDKNILKRIKNTSPQVKLKSEARAQNIGGAFKGDAINRVSTKYLLIDDVITTGATMNECAKVLKENGAGKVYGLALARG